METLSFTINKTTITLSDYTMDSPYLTGHNTDYTCVFTCSSEWENTTKYATFSNTRSGIIMAQLLENNACQIPYAVLTYGDIDIGVVGRNGTEIIKSSHLIRLAVENDAASNDDEIDPPDESIYNQIISRLSEIDRGISDAYVDDNDGHLYILLTNGDTIDCGTVVEDISDRQITFAYLGDNGHLMLVQASGNVIDVGLIGGSDMPAVTAEDNGKVLQVQDGEWKVKKAELDEDTLHIMTNLEIASIFNS